MLNTSLAKPDVSVTSINYNMYCHIVTVFIQTGQCTVEPRYNEVLGTMKNYLVISGFSLYQVSHYIRVKKQRNMKSWDQQNYLVIRGFCYIRPLYNEVPLYILFWLIYTLIFYLCICRFRRGHSSIHIEDQEACPLHAWKGEPALLPRHSCRC